MPKAKADDAKDTNNRGRSNKRASIYDAAIRSNSKDAALSIIKEANPRFYIFNYRTIMNKLDDIFNKVPPYVSPFESFQNVPQSLLDWASKNIQPPQTRVQRPQSIIIEGPSRIGKTCWARSLGPHNYYAGYMYLKNHDDDAYYNIIDNIDPKSLKYWKEFIGSQRDWSATSKYARRRNIKGGIPTIILCNPDASYSEYLQKPKNKDLYEWTKSYAEFHFLRDPLFTVEDKASSSKVQETTISSNAS